MSIYHLNDMTRGWFVGDFEPTAYKTQNAEVAIKHFVKGDTEDAHYHKIATEITTVLSGKIRMGEHVLSAGDIIVLEPGQVSDFEALEDSVCTAVKVPGAKHDKYLVDPKA